jgi:hypothetical protein
MCAYIWPPGEEAHVCIYIWHPGEEALDLRHISLHFPTGLPPREEAVYITGLERRQLMSHAIFSAMLLDKLT